MRRRVPGLGLLSPGPSALLRTRHRHRPLPAAIADLTARGHDPRLTALTGDIRDLPPQKPYDAMVFCLFGGTDEILDIAARSAAAQPWWCGGISGSTSSAPASAWRATPPPTWSRSCAAGD